MVLAGFQNLFCRCSKTKSSSESSPHPSTIFFCWLDFNGSDDFFFHPFYPPKEIRFGIFFPLNPLRWWWKMIKSFSWWKGCVFHYLFGWLRILDPSCFFLVIAIQQGGGEPQVGLPTTTGRMPQRERLLVGFTGSTLAGLGDPQTSLRWSLLFLTLTNDVELNF